MVPITLPSRSYHVSRASNAAGLREHQDVICRSRTGCCKQRRGCCREPARQQGAASPFSSNRRLSNGWAISVPPRTKSKYPVFGSTEGEYAGCSCWPPML